MDTASLIKKIRQQQQLSQEEFAAQLSVTRQAVSRWETGKTTPNHETLKTLSATYQITINTLLGSPENLSCQACGMPLTKDEWVSQEKDQQFNEAYCKWCYKNGEFQYKTMDEMIAFLLPLWRKEQESEEAVRKELERFLPSLKHWK